MTSNNKNQPTGKAQIKLKGAYINPDKSNIDCLTPAYLIDILIPYLNKKETIWLPFTKKEHLIFRYLKNKGYKVIQSHISDGQDFLTYEPKEQWEMAMDNVPFRNKTEWINRFLTFNKKFCAVLPITFLNDKGIPNLFTKSKKEIQILIPQKRAEFYNDNTSQSTRSSFKTVWMCVDVLPKQIIFTEFNPLKYKQENIKIFKQRKRNLTRSFLDYKKAIK